MNNDYVANIRKKYKTGMRIKLIQMIDESYTPVPSGTTGTIDHIDDIGTLHIRWDNGQSLGLIVGLDLFEIL